MTYQEKYKELLQKVTDTWNKLLEADKEVAATNGFANIDQVPEYRRAYSDWQYAQNSLNNFLIWVKNNGINPNDKIV